MASAQPDGRSGYVPRQLPPVRHKIPEFWSPERVEYVRRMALTGNPPRVIDGSPSKIGRLLDRMTFRGLRPEDVEAALAEAGGADIDVGIELFGTRLEAPVYIGDMSYGALSGGPNIAVARAAAEAGVLAGIGEGGLHPEVAKYRNIVVQWASARFGMDMDLLRSGIAVNLKIGQGAKPGIGGHLPGAKVTDVISELRKIPVGSDALSPAPHHDIYSIEDLSQRVKALRDLSGKPVLVKVAAVNKIMFVAVGVARSTAEGIIIDGAGAGTGAAPAAIRDHLGIPIDYAIPVSDRWLRENGARDGFSMIGGGLIYSPSDVAKLIALGADAANLGTAALLSFGCTMCHSCYTGGCPVYLTSMALPVGRFDVEAGTRALVRYIEALGRGLRAILASLGMKDISELRGRRDLLELHYVDEDVADAVGVELAEGGDLAWYQDYEPILYREMYEDGSVHITGMGGIIPGYTYPARRPLDLLRIEAAQVTHPPVDPYREDIDVGVRTPSGAFEVPVVVPGIDPAASAAAEALGALVDGGKCRNQSNCIGSREHYRVSPGDDVEPRPGFLVIDERGGGPEWLEESLSKLDRDANLMGVRDGMTTVAVGRFNSGADIYKLAALGADLVEPVEAFELLERRIRGMDYLARRTRYENLIIALVEELQLSMGAGGLTNYYHMVGNRDLVRSLDGSVARSLGVRIAGT
ncbi:MAG: glutamate synthase-related protein [Nitrososphaeria archaeon]